MKQQRRKASKRCTVFFVVFFCLFLRCLLFHVKISGSITNQGFKKKVRQFGGKYFGVGCYQRGLALPKAASVGGHETIIPASLAPPSVPVPNKQDVLHFPRSWCSCGEERRAAWDSSGLGYFLRPESPVLGSKLPGSSIIRIFFLKLSTCVCRVTSVMSDSLLPYGPQPTRLLCPQDSLGKKTSGLPCPPAGDLPDPGIKPTSLTSPALAGGFFTTSTTWEAVSCLLVKVIQLF